MGDRKGNNFITNGERKGAQVETSTVKFRPLVNVFYDRYN